MIKTRADELVVGDIFKFKKMDIASWEVERVRVLGGIRYFDLQKTNGNRYRAPDHPLPDNMLLHKIYKTKCPFAQ
jgi:hypothetical protein